MDWKQYFDSQEIIDTLISHLPQTLATLGILFAFWLTYKLTRKPFLFFLSKRNFSTQLSELLVQSVYKYSLWVVAIIMAASQMGINVAAALAGVGVIGLAVGLAAQDSLSNIIAGFIIFADKPFQINDWITVDDKYGKVVRITLRSTRIRTLNNTYVVIPNHTIINETLVNHSKNGITRIDVPIGIAYKEKVAEARPILLEAVKDMKELSKEHAPDVVVSGLGDSSVNLFVRIWIDDAKDEQVVYFEAIERAKVALDAAGIEIPFPHLQLHIDEVADTVVKKLQK